MQLIFRLASRPQTNSKAAGGVMFTRLMSVLPNSFVSALYTIDTAAKSASIVLAAPASLRACTCSLGCLGTICPVAMAAGMEHQTATSAYVARSIVCGPTTYDIACALFEQRILPVVANDC